MSTLDVVLDRLIHRRSSRAAFLSGHSAPGLSEADRDALESLDRSVLVELSIRVATELLTRKHAGSGSLLDLYPETIEAFRARHDGGDLLELSYSFMDSEAFAEYREIPHAGRGPCLEEAFFRYAEAEALADPTVREREFLVAMAKFLCASPRADVLLPAEVRRAPGGFYAVASLGAPVLYGGIL